MRWAILSSIPQALPALRASVAGQGPAAVLRLPPELLLEQQATLPIAAERDPERVLSYEMDRITPFTADELFWTWAVERRDRIQGRLYLRLLLVPKIRLAPVLAAIARGWPAPCGAGGPDARWPDAAYRAGPGAAGAMAQA